MTKKACIKCRVLAEKAVCPICGGNQFSETWKGRLVVLDAEKSDIAKNLDIKINGEYALKVR